MLPVWRISWLESCPTLFRCCWVCVGRVDCSCQQSCSVNLLGILMSLLFESCWGPGCSLRALPRRRQSSKRHASSRDGESVMSSEVRQSGRQPYRQPDQAEADGVIQAIFAEEAEGEADAPSAFFPQGIVRRAKLQLFPKADHPSSAPDSEDSSWQQSWVVDSQIIEDPLAFGPESYESQGTTSVAQYADALPTFPEMGPASSMAQEQPSPAPSPDGAEPEMRETSLIVSETRPKVTAQLATVQGSIRAPSAEQPAELPDSAFRDRK